VDLGEVDVPHVVCGVIVADLTTSPVHAFDFDDFVGFDGSIGGVFGMPAVLCQSIRVSKMSLTALNNVRADILARMLAYPKIPLPRNGDLYPC
jgi:hypothetical protein